MRLSKLLMTSWASVFTLIRSTLKTLLIKKPDLYNLSSIKIFIIVVAFVISACEPLADPMDFTRDQAIRMKASTITEMSAPQKTDPIKLRVMSWNIKYGALRIPFWFDCWGDRVQMSLDEVESHMGQIYEMITEANPDILIVEEIEIHSRRSAYYDMVQGILDSTGLNYAAYFETWDSRYVPSEGLGRMNLGNAIFSKYPIPRAELIKQSSRTDQDPVTNTFYIKRSIGRAEIQVGELNLATYAVHTEAYDVDGTKAKQINQIYNVVMEEELPFILGGDFNELPPKAVQIKDFPDERTEAICSDDFKQPPYTPNIMQPFYDDLVPWVTEDEYGTTIEQQARFFTHSVLGPNEVNESGEAGEWNRTLDYLFASPNTRWVAGSTDVLQRAGQVIGNRPDVLSWTLEANPLEISDHAPVFGVWEVTP